MLFSYIVIFHVDFSCYPPPPHKQAQTACTSGPLYFCLSTSCLWNHSHSEPDLHFQIFPWYLWRFIFLQMLCWEQNVKRTLSLLTKEKKFIQWDSYMSAFAYFAINDFSSASQLLGYFIITFHWIPYNNKQWNHEKWSQVVIHIDIYIYIYSAEYYTIYGIFPSKNKRKV